MEEKEYPFAFYVLIHLPAFGPLKKMVLAQVEKMCKSFDVICQAKEIPASEDQYPRRGFLPYRLDLYGKRADAEQVAYLIGHNSLHPHQADEKFNKALEEKII